MLNNGGGNTGDNADDDILMLINIQIYMGYMTDSGRGIPSFDELKQFVAANRFVTFCDIRDAFELHGDDEISITGIMPGTTVKKTYILAYGIKKDVHKHLVEFFKQPCIRMAFNAGICEDDIVEYTGPHTFLSVVLSVNQ